MSDSKKVCTKVLRVLKKQMKRTPERNRVVMAMMITGLVLSRHSQLSLMAIQTPSQAQEESTVTRFRRLLSNEHVDVKATYLPFAKQILGALSNQPLMIAMDGSTTAKGCMTLMVGVVYKRRLLPLTWIVYKGNKGHTTAPRHIEALE